MFQTRSNPNYLAFVIISTVIITLVMFLIGILITRWRAKKKEWNYNWKPAILLNLFWAIIQLIFYGIFAFVPFGVYYGIVITLLINIFIGAYVATKLYEQDYKDALVFVLIIQIILFIIAFIVSYLLGTLLMIIILGEVIDPYTQ